MDLYLNLATFQYIDGFGCYHFCLNRIGLQLIASTMLHRPEPTKERVEPTILSTIAIEITHLTTFAFLLLLRILRYMWRNHVANWAQANNSDRNLDLNKIRFSHLHYILQ